VAAFANSTGGFLVLGVKDDKGLPAADRIVGLPATYDFPEHFGNYPSACEPSVEWAFKNDPPRSPSTRTACHDAPCLSGGCPLSRLGRLPIPESPTVTERAGGCG
jgi:hypothetical protein